MVTDRVIIVKNGFMTMNITQKPYYVKEITGIDGLESTIVTSQGFNQSGATVVNTIVEPRAIEIYGQIKAESTESMQNIRGKLLNLYAHGKDIVMEHYYGGIGRKINVRVENGPVFNLTEISKVEEYNVKLLASDPYWEEIEEERYSIANWIPKLHFPLIVPIGEKIVFGVKNISTIVNVQNKSTIEIPMIIVFKANGTLKNPQLFDINTRKFIRINCSMDSGDTLTVDTKTSRPTVIFNSGGVAQSYINKIDIVNGGNTFLRLQPGNNLLRHSAEEGESNLELEIFVKNKYGGV